jgi:O-antigen biosynthesis protein
MEPAYKAAWSPEYFLSFMYIGHLSVYRRALVEQVGRFRAGLEGSQDYDLALRVSELARRIVHIPAILYNWRKHPESVAANIHAKPYAFEAAKRALRDAMLRRGYADARVEDTWAAGIYKTSIVLPKPPQVLLLAYFAREEGMDRALSKLRAGTGYAAMEIMAGIVSRSSSAGAAAVQGRSNGGVYRSLSAFIKQAASAGAAEYVLLLDGRLLPQAPDWLEHLVQYAVRDGVGIVGAKIRTPQGRCLHAGYTVLEGRAAHNGYAFHEHDPGYACRLAAAHNVSAVSSLCLLADAALLEQSGVCQREYWCDTAFDLDLGLSARSLGRRVVWTPHAQLVLEGEEPEKIVELKNFPRDLALLEERHHIGAYDDPYYPPGLDRIAMDFRAAL